MSTLKTKSSELIGISFPIELAKLLREHAVRTDKPFPYVVRQACMLFLNANGIRTDDIPNSTGKGSRSDLKTLSASESRERLQHLLANRKLKH